MDASPLRSRKPLTRLASFPPSPHLIFIAIANIITLSNHRHCRQIDDPSHPAVRKTASMAGEMWMMERATEELKRLEARHPERFDYLKLELRSIISDYDLNPNLITSASSAATQASSNRKRREAEFRDGDLGFELEKKRLKSSSEDRAEMAIERAKACLRRIRLVKESFLL